MERTNPDNAETVMIKANPNSLPFGICPTTYGSRKIYSEIIERRIKSTENITPPKTIYL